MNIEAKVIRTKEQYDAYLGEVQSLMAHGPSLNSVESEKLELFTVLLESYENSKFPVESPDPIDAILFRMNEKGLKRADLVPYFGTSSRVSEVLGRKRPLTVQMIRALSLGLGISAETLVGVGTEHETKVGEVDWSQFPIKEMTKRGWFSSSLKQSVSSVENTVKEFIADAGLSFGAASFKRTISGEAHSPTTKYALYAWLARVIQTARERRKSLGDFNHDVINAAFLKELAQLSWFEKGPLLAVEYLERHGIAVVIEPHLKGTLLDGAALKDIDGTPIIGLTLRHDRIDNFWFTLLHEVAHLWKHVNEQDAFLDDLDASSEDRRESEANRLAREAFIPRLIWKRSDAFQNPSREAIDRLSRELKIHPSIVAGRVRRETGNYQLFTDMVGFGQIRALFQSTLDSEV